VATAIPGETLQKYLLSERFRLLPHVVWARYADAIVVLDAEHGRHYTLNEVAGRIWELLVGGEPLVEVLQLLRDEYEVAGEALEADVAAQLDRLLEAALIERVAP
jgi:hypothetical protein